MHKLVLGSAVLLLSGSSAWAQTDKKTTATTTPTHLPGEEKLSAQERAERDFLMPVRRKQAAVLRATAEEASLHQPAVEVTARNLEAAEDDKPAEAAEVKAAPATVHRSTRSYHRRSSSSRHRSSSSVRKKTTAKKSTAKKKTTSRRRR